MAVLQDFLDNIAALLEDTAHAYYTDAQTTVGLRWALSEYSKMHPGEPIAIDDLDGAVATTLATADWKDVEVGAAGFTALIRSISRVETINMQPDVTDHLKATADKYLSTFLASDITLQHDKAADAIALEEIKAGHVTDRDAALDIDAIAMEELKDGHLAARENAKYAADIALQSAKADDETALQVAQFHHELTKEEVKRMNTVGKEYMTRFLNSLSPLPGIQVASLDYPAPMKF